MSAGYQALTEKEKQTLRLIVRGHDAKSTARHLGLSVHTINERLRDARRKLSVSSSREAARLVLDREGGAVSLSPDSFGDKLLGEAGGAAGMADHSASETRHAAKRGFALAMAGAAIMSFLLATLALTSLPQTGEPPAAFADSSSPETAASVSDAARASRQWLALVDADDWAASHAATADNFRELNTLEVWTSVSEKVRGDLGATLSRTLIAQESVPAPPNGLEMVKFRTRFAHKADAIETLSLAREGGTWKVVGYYID